MKSIIYIVLSLIALSLANPNKTSSHSTQHTFLVKTELTKEQIEKLLYEHHLNQTQLLEKTNLHQNENETQENHNSQETSETTELKAKKQKKEKNQNKNKEQKVEQEMEKEIPEPQEEQPTPQPPVQEEIEPVEKEIENELNETTNLKAKKGKKKKKENADANEVKELNETEVKEAMNETEALIEVGNSNNDCPEQKTTLIEKTENTPNNLNQCNSPIFNFICVAFLTIAFISFFIYATQPKKKVYNNYYMNQRIKVKV